MDYIIEGKCPLFGELSVYGAKNCALALLGASVLTSDTIVLKNCPHIVDVENMLLLLSALGKSVARNGDIVTICGDVTTYSVPREQAKLLRGSGLVLGALVSVCGEAFLPSTGGCAIGARPIDIHLDGLKAMGVSVEENKDGVYCVGKPVGCDFALRFPSVGATENLLCAAVCASGETVFENCALEPEVTALEQLLVKMGAELSGIGTKKIRISGVNKLHGAEFSIIPDRIVACTYLACAVAAGGKLAVTNCEPQHFSAFLRLLKCHFDVNIFEHEVEIYADCSQRPQGYGNIVTEPYPGFPTDVQQPMLSLCAMSGGGTSSITETLFENRLYHNVEQLNRMGASVRIEDIGEVSGGRAVSVGRNLHGAEVFANDLRGGAGLTIAALGADGTTILHGVEHISRGYRDFDAALRSVGAKVFLSDG